VAFGRLSAPVHFYGVTHSLKGVERQSYGQDDLQEMILRATTGKLQGSIHIVDEEIEILEVSEKTDVEHEAQNQPGPPGCTFAFLYPDTSEIVNYNGNT
jgi:hypothetical protein